MKITTSKCRIILLICLIISPTILLAYNNFYLNNTTSPQVTNMFRFGDVETSLFTGKVNLAIPIYQLEDPDFNLNIALRYNAEGFKPKKHSGHIGYNWFLEAGGCITREVRNIPDEYLRDYSSYSVKGMLPFTLYDKVDKNSIFMLSDDVVRECSTFSFNLDINCDNDIDYLPDIFNFNFCGYHGKFMINNQGEVVIIDGDYVTVDLSKFVDTVRMTANKQYATPNLSSRITIKTIDGYTYIFGGDQSSVEYTLTIEDNQIPMQYPPSISTWHLKKIIAPNQREVCVYYKDIENHNHKNPDPIWIFNEYYDYFKQTDYERSLNQANIGQNNTTLDFSKISQNITKGCIIDSIVVFGQSNVHISFHSSTAPMKFYNHNHYPLCKNNYMLDSICVKTDERILTNARLTSIYKSFVHSGTNGLGYSWRFLSSVDIDGVGKYLLEYNHPTCYPDIYTIGDEYRNIIDFYGYCKSNVFSGTLKKITYPTGGYQIFTYEKNRCGIERRYKTHGAADVQMSSLNRNNVLVSGIRIANIDTYVDNQLIEKTTYTYEQKGTNKSSGIYYNQAQIYLASDSTQSFLTHGNGCYSLLDSHIGYSYVEEKIKRLKTGEESKVGYAFSTGKTSFNSSTDFTINRIPKEKARIIPLCDTDYILSSMLNYDSKLDGSGQLLLIEYYKNNVLTQSIQFEYNGIDNLSTELMPQAPTALGCTDTVIIFSHYFAPIARKLFVYPNVLTQKIVKDYDSNEQFSLNSTNYTYDSKFRIKRETVSNSDGTKHFTTHTYIDDLPTSEWHRKIFSIPNPYAFLLETNRISTPIETTFGYIDNEQEYIIGGKLNLYNIILHVDFPKKNSLSLLPSFLLPIDSLKNFSDSLVLLLTGYHLSLQKTLTLSLTKGIQDYHPIFSTGDTISYDNRFRFDCEYTFDEMNRLVRIAPYGKQETRYTWDGIYPTSQTTGNQTFTFTYIPYVGVSSTTDPRGVTTYYEYDTYGRLIEVYQLNNGKKEILNKYIHHIKTE